MGLQRVGHNWAQRQEPSLWLNWLSMTKWDCRAEVGWEQERIIVQDGFFFFLATSCRMCNHTLSYITCSPEARAPRGGCRHSPSPAHHSSVYCLGFSRGSCPHGLKVVVSCITWSHTPFGWRYWHQGVFVSFDTVTNGHKFCGLKQQKCIIPQLWRSEGKIDLSGQNKHVGRAAFFGVSGESQFLRLFQLPETSCRWCSSYSLALTLTSASSSRCLHWLWFSCFFSFFFF